MTMGHRIAVMRDGILQQLDTPQVLYDRPANMFVAGFIGSPSMNFFEGKLTGSESELWVETGTLKLRVPDHKLGAVRSAVGRDVIFGIRPEDIHDPADRVNAPDHQRAKVAVEVVEPLGSEQFVYLRSGNQEFTSRMSARAQLMPGNNVDVVFDTDKMHVFDKQTEMALG
jgi:multiple sugar transport system ATP-binding protein